MLKRTCPLLSPALRRQQCGKKAKASLAMVASGILFPLLVWGGHVLLPFDPPVALSAPLRVVYALRCSFFAAIPILLGETRVCRTCDEATPE